MAREKSISELYYATSSSDKLELVSRFLEKNAPHISLKPCTHNFIEIQSYDQQEVALDKARQAWEFLKKTVLIDDAGFYIAKYRDILGVLTKFVYRGIGLEGCMKLVNPGDKAYFKVTMVYWYAPGKYEIFIGQCHGHIVNPVQCGAREESTCETFFVPDGETRTIAELRAIGNFEKSHYRLDALKKFLHWYI